MTEPSAANGGSPKCGPVPATFCLRALLAITALLSALIVLAMLLEIGWEVFELASPSPDALPTHWALLVEAIVLGLMVAAAAKRKRLRSLFESKELMIWLGGVLILTSGFFRLIYGPWASNISLYGIISWNLSWSGLPMLIMAWPMAFGAVVAIMGFVAIIFGSPVTRRWQWMIVSLFLAFVAAIHVALFLWFGGWDRPVTERMTYLGAYCGILVLLIAAITLPRRDFSRSQLVHLIAGAWLLPSLYVGMTIGGESVPLTDVLRACGAGYWMSSLGTVMIFCGSLWMLAGLKRVNS